YEKQHIIDALCFELGQVNNVSIRERMLKILSYIDSDLATKVAVGLGATIPKNIGLVNQNIPADADPKSYQPILKKSSLKKSNALSMANTIKDSIITRKVAILAGD